MTRYSRDITRIAVVAWLVGLVSGGAGVYTLWQPPAKPPAPFQVRVAAGKAHAAASITALPATEADAVLRTLASQTSCIPDRDGRVSYAEVEACILAYLTALQSPRTNREGQPQDLTPRPFVLHPGKTPLVDPTTGFRKEAR